MVEVTADGRVRRGERNRDAIVEALLSLYDEGILRPSANQVAERAGVSPRSVHNHFADMESLRAAVADRQWSRVLPLMEPVGETGALHDRIDAVVQRRSALFEAITPVRRAAMLSVHDSPEIARRLSRAGRILRKHLEDVFAAELGRAQNAGDVLESLDVLTSWEAWERLRAQQRLSAAAARRVLAASLHALLDPYDTEDRG